MRSWFVLTVLAVLAAPPAWAQDCESLYARRNAIYKDGGYCFKTPRAIRMFGNAGCQYDEVDDVPLSARQRRDVAALRDEERFRGCTDQ